MTGQTLQQMAAQALAHHNAGRLEEAEAAYRQALTVAPPAVPATATLHYNLAVLLRDRGQLDEAALHYGRAARLNPANPKAHNNLGAVQQALGRLDEAEASLRRALALDPAYADAHYNLGNVLKARGEPAEAADAYARAAALDPQDADTQGNLGLALQALGRLDEAEAHIRRALTLRPRDARSHDNLGVLLRAKGREKDAIEQHVLALRIDPQFAGAHYNLGFVLGELGRIDEAAASYRRAIAADPASAEARNNLGHLLTECGRDDEALRLHDEAVALKPDYADAHWNGALIRLRQGDLEAGWAGYEWRLRLEGFRPTSLAEPRWDGADLAGKTILLHAEQGAGDTIQFVRYAALAKQRGAGVVVESPPELARLLRTAPGVDRVIAPGEPRPRFDVHAPMPSLPGLFATRLDSIPAVTPYLAADPDLAKTWRRRLAGRPGLKAGLVWRGNPAHSRDRVRSISAQMIAGLLDTPGVRWLNLQRDARAEEFEAFARFAEVDNTAADLADWADTAALVEALDLVVTVDTAVAHLAGALGKRTVLLLPFTPDWRWLLGREDSPWYPSLRLIRQSALGDWRGVIAQARRLIAELT